MPSLLTPLWESFYSTRLYYDVRPWRGKAIAYLAVVLALCWTAVAIRVHWRVMHIVDEVLTQTIPQVPVIRVEGGKVSTPENRPYLVQAGTPSRVIAIVDTTGKYSSLKGQDAHLLVAHDSFSIRYDKDDVRTYDLSRVKSRGFLIDQDLLIKFVGYATHWMLPALYIAVFAASFFIRLIQAFFIALLGMAVSGVLDMGLDLGELFSLAIVAMTPAMLLETLVTVLGKGYGLPWMVTLMIITVYYLVALNSVRFESRQAPPNTI